MLGKGSKLEVLLVWGDLVVVALKNILSIEQKAWLVTLDANLFKYLCYSSVTIMKKCGIDEASKTVV